MKKKPNPIPTADDLCIVCGKPYAHTHEIFFGNPNAALSQKYKMTARLCQYHHQDHKAGVHHNREFDLQLKKEYQLKFIEMYPELDFLTIFRKNYL